jgi:hypothetical protein
MKPNPQSYEPSFLRFSCNAFGFDRLSTITTVFLASMEPIGG